MIKPLDFDPNKEYPMFMYQYSGPGSQSVSNSWGGSNDYWHQMLAQEGYIVVCVDGRGTGLKGRDFKKMTQKELGKYEVEDQIAAAKKLGELPVVLVTSLESRDDRERGAGHAGHLDCTISYHIRNII